ncbi:Mic26p [Rhodotorula paludigena]|uniref:Mic26p n=1 Tax=Rhodotorula paludigena TaxID=86838 RepID=UPI00317491F5
MAFALKVGSPPRSSLHPLPLTALPSSPSSSSPRPASTAPPPPAPPQLAAGGLAGAGAALYLNPALLEDRARLAANPAASHSVLARPADPESLRSRLPLYDAPAEPTVLVPVKSPLQDEVARARRSASDTLDGVKHHTADLRQQWLEWEAKGEAALKSVISDKDQLNPNALYVAVATLAGSIVGRNRILLRLTLPPVFLAASTAYLLPHSWDRIARRAGLPEEWRDVRGAVDRWTGGKA